MSPIFYIILRRLRFPLILLVCAYWIAITGLTLIPGVDENGNEIYFSIFHAFYFFSYVATTIGFGEIPHTFTDTQRLWVVFCIYLTVISWLVAIGQILALLSEPSFKLALNRQRFAKKIKKINTPFYIICGYGETGQILLKQLSSVGKTCIIIENDPLRSSLIDIDNSSFGTIHIQGDASNVEILKLAGTVLPNCSGVIAVTNNDSINVKIALATKLLHRDVKVVCRATSREATANAKSFDTDFVVNPFTTFSEEIALAIRRPSIRQLITLLHIQNGEDYPEKQEIPTGNWIICGYDNMGKEMARFLDYEGVDTVIIDPSFKESEEDKRYIKGKGTESIPLRAAGIEKASGIVAATNDDADNLSIIITAHNLKPDIFTIGRQNLDSNYDIFNEADINVVMENARLLVSQIIPLITQPYLSLFSRMAKHQSEEWGADVVRRIKEVSPEKTPKNFVVKLNDKYAPAVVSEMRKGSLFRLREMYIDPENTSENLPVIPLLLIRDGVEFLLPDPQKTLKTDDIILFVADNKIIKKMDFALHNPYELHYLLHGEQKPISPILNYIQEKIKGVSK